MISDLDWSKSNSSNITSFTENVNKLSLPHNINGEFMRQDGRKKRTAKRLCVTNLTWLLLGHFVIFTSHLCFLDFDEKICLKEGEVWQKVFIKQNYCHACHSRFAVFFPLLSYYVSSLMLWRKEQLMNNKHVKKLEWA